MEFSVQDMTLPSLLSQTHTHTHHVPVPAPYIPASHILRTVVRCHRFERQRGVSVSSSYVASSSTSSTSTHIGPFSLLACLHGWMPSFPALLVWCLCLSHISLAHLRPDFWETCLEGKAGRLGVRGDDDGWMGRHDRDVPAAWKSGAGLSNKAGAEGGSVLLLMRRRNRRLFSGTGTYPSMESIEIVKLDDILLTTPYGGGCVDYGDVMAVYISRARICVITSPPSRSRWVV